jgi:hypothetical protein
MLEDRLGTCLSAISAPQSKSQLSIAECPVRRYRYLEPSNAQQKIRIQIRRL